MKFIRLKGGVINDVFLINPNSITGVSIIPADPSPVLSIHLSDGTQHRVNKDQLCSYGKELFFPEDAETISSRKTIRELNQILKEMGLLNPSPMPPLEHYKFYSDLQSFSFLNPEK